jgi:hypothetical protein
VFDEAHTFTGAQGAETACADPPPARLLRQGRSQHGVHRHVGHHRRPGERLEAGRDFASRFFGVAGSKVALVGESYENDLWGTPAKPARR